MPALPTITPLPSPPNRSMDADTFTQTADAFLAALTQFAADTNAFAAAVPSAVNPANFIGNSTTSITVGTGTKTLNVETGKLYYAGQWLIVARPSAPSTYMFGQCTAYDSNTGSLAVNVTLTSGSGTFAVWVVGAANTPGTATAPRVVTATTFSGTIQPDSTNADLYIMAGLNGAVSVSTPSGTIADGKKLMLRLKDDGTSRALTWAGFYRPIGSVVLPTATVAGKTHYIGLIGNAADTKWDVIAALVQP